MEKNLTTGSVFKNVILTREASAMRQSMTASAAMLMIGFLLPA